MCKKKVSVFDCRNGNDYGRVAKLQGAEVIDKYGYIKIRTPMGEGNVPKSDTDLPKPARNVFTKICLGLGLSVATATSLGTILYCASKWGFVTLASTYVVSLIV